MEMAVEVGVMNLFKKHDSGFYFYNRNVILERRTSRTLFVVRTGLLERSMLAEIENLYKLQKFRNLSVVLNDTDVGGNRYGHRYHYEYGYGYKQE